MISQFLTG